MEPFLIQAARDLRVDFVVDKGMFARTINVPLKPFAMIVTATSEARCSRSLRELFSLTVPVRRYTQTELERICIRVGQSKGVSLTPPIADMVVRLADGSTHRVEVLTSRLAGVGKSILTDDEAMEILSVFGLKKRPNPELGVAADLQNLSGIDFERAVAELLGRMGFQTEMTKSSGDGGIDIIASLNRPLVGGRYLVQCKRLAPGSLVGAPIVREFYGALTADRTAVKGILITTSGFTNQAREFAAGLPIELIDGAELSRLLSNSPESL